MLPHEKDNQIPEPERPPESLEQKRDRERRRRSGRRSWLPTVVFLSLHALLLFLGIVYLIPWIQNRLHKPPPSAPEPIAPPPVKPTPELKAPPLAPPPTPSVVEPPKPPEKVVPFPPPSASEEITKLIDLARNGIKGKVLVVRQGGGGYKTIGDAMKAAADGDTVEIADNGTYHEAVVIREKKNILLRAGKDVKPVIDVESRQDFCIRALSAPGVVIRGVICVKARDTAISIGRGCERAVVAENLAEHSNFGIRATSANVAILANVCGSNRVGIAVEQGPQSVIVDNVSTENEWSGVKAARSPGTIILNNIISFARGEEGIKISHSDNSMILRNTIVVSYKPLIRVEQSNGVGVMNNIAVRGSQAAISFDPAVKNAVCDYNLIHEIDFIGHWQAKQYNVLETWKNATGHDAHSLYDAPGFLEDDRDFRLRPDSPGRGKASNGMDLGVCWDKSGLTFLDEVLKDTKPTRTGRRGND
ncbi:MAG: NosD domain-containing protein [Planctomycetota bacterium]